MGSGLVRSQTRRQRPDGTKANLVVECAQASPEEAQRAVEGYPIGRPTVLVRRCLRMRSCLTASTHGLAVHGPSRELGIKGRLGDPLGPKRAGAIRLAPFKHPDRSAGTCRALHDYAARVRPC
jgi:hypothetical protein